MLAHLAEAPLEAWGAKELSDLSSFVAMQLAVTTSMVTVLVSSRLYTQLAFWMPSLEVSSRLARGARLCAAARRATSCQRESVGHSRRARKVGTESRPYRLSNISTPPSGPMPGVWTSGSGSGSGSSLSNAFETGGSCLLR